MVGGLGHLNGAGDIGNGLALGDQLLSGLELADDLYSFGEAFGYGCVADAFRGEVPGPVWPDKDSHSPWTDFRGPRQTLMRLNATRSRFDKFKRIKRVSTKKSVRQEGY